MLGKILCPCIVREYRDTVVCRGIMEPERREELVRCLEQDDCGGVEIPTNAEIWELVGEMWEK